MTTIGIVEASITEELRVKSATKYDVLERIQCNAIQQCQDKGPGILRRS
jgi:hypothetical protein